MRWAGVALVVAAAAAVPTLLPPSTFRAAWVPDLAALALVHAAFRGTPDRAALLGVVLGLAGSPWRPEPVPWQAFVLGATGYLIAHGASGIVRDRMAVRAAGSAIAVLVLRGGTLLAAAVADTEPLSSEAALRATVAAAIAAAAAALATAPFAAAARRWRLLTPLERSFRDV